MKWIINECRPSDGTKIGNIKIDHTGELKREDGTYLLLQCGSYKITTDEWINLLNIIVNALNK